MPELPEVENILNEIQPFLIGNQIKYSIIRNYKLRYPISREIIDINNEIILNIQRRAKYLLIKLNYGWIIIHLGMSGSIRILKNQEIAKKHDHIDLIFTNGQILRYTDPRKFGLWLWINKIENSNLFSMLGPEPLSIEFNSDYFYQKSINVKTKIKPWLMNNKIVVGIGNIYANEILYAAKILPTRIVNSLTKKEICYLVFQIKTILKSAIQYGGTTLNNFFHTDGTTGFFSQKLLIYGKKNTNCINCNQLIKIIRLQQRSTFFCSKCQK